MLLDIALRCLAIKVVYDQILRISAVLRTVQWKTITPWHISVSSETKYIINPRSDTPVAFRYFLILFKVNAVIKFRRLFFYLK